MELNIRRLTENDWDTLCLWWEAWPEWVNPPKDFLPDNGTGGLIVEKDVPIAAGFIYYTNSKGALFEWVVSNPDYREADRKDAIELLIKSAEEGWKQKGGKFLFFWGNSTNLNNNLMENGFIEGDTNYSHLIKKI